MGRRGGLRDASLRHPVFFKFPIPDLFRMATQGSNLSDLEYDPGFTTVIRESSLTDWFGWTWSWSRSRQSVYQV